MLEWATTYLGGDLLPSPPPAGTPPVRAHPTTKVSEQVVHELKKLFGDNRYIQRMLECAEYLKLCYLAVVRLLHSMSSFTSKDSLRYECYTFIENVDSFEPFELLLCLVYIGIANEQNAFCRMIFHFSAMAKPNGTNATQNKTLYTSMDKSCRSGRAILRVESIRQLSKQAGHLAEWLQVGCLRRLPGQSQLNKQEGSKNLSGPTAQAMNTSTRLAAGMALYLGRCLKFGEEARVAREGDALPEGQEKGPLFRSNFFQNLM